jgi:nicotinamidase-related amidase
LSYLSDFPASSGHVRRDFAEFRFLQDGNLLSCFLAKLHVTSQMTKNQTDWSSFALLLIDVQKDFWPEAVAREFPDLPARIERLLALCRQAGIAVIHLRAGFAPDRSDWMAKYRLSGSVPCIRGTAGAQVLPCAEALPGEPVIEKQCFDGFQTRELLPLLRRQGIRFLLTAGIETSVCVLFTTATAAQMGFLTAVVEDGCADLPEKHHHTLKGYPFIFERVTVDKVIDNHARWMGMLDQLAASELPAK